MSWGREGRIVICTNGCAQDKTVAFLFCHKPVLHMLELLGSKLLTNNKYDEYHSCFYQCRLAYGYGDT